MNQRSAGVFAPMTVTNLSGPRPSTGSAASFALPFGAPPLPAASAEAILRRGTRCVRTSDSVPMQLSDTNAIIARFCLSVNHLCAFPPFLHQKPHDPAQGLRHLHAHHPHPHIVTSSPHKSAPARRLPAPRQAAPPTPMPECTAAAQSALPPPARRPQSSARADPCR